MKVHRYDHLTKPGRYWLEAFTDSNQWIAQSDGTATIVAGHFFREPQAAEAALVKKAAA